MKPRQVAAALLAASALTISGCGSQPTEGPSSESAPSSAPADREVEGVMMTQLGGISGVRRTWRVSHRTLNAARVFAAAEDEGLSNVVKAAAEESSEACCDFLVYDITIRYADGESLRLRSSDSQQSIDPAVTRLVNAVLATPPLKPDR